MESVNAKVEEPEDANISDLSYFSIPPEEEWRVPFLSELLNIKAGRLQTDLTKRMIIQLIYDVAVN